MFYNNAHNTDHPTPTTNISISCFDECNDGKVICCPPSPTYSSATPIKLGEKVVSKIKTTSTKSMTVVDCKNKNNNDIEESSIVTTDSSLDDETSLSKCSSGSNSDTTKNTNHTTTTTTTTTTLVTSSTTGSGSSEDDSGTSWDIICGRNKSAFNHVGNRRFRVTISIYLQRYLERTSRTHRSLLNLEIVETIQQAGGRFFKKVKVPGNGGKYQLIELSEKEKRNKVGHALRDAASTFISNQKKIKIQQEQELKQNQEKEQKQQQQQQQEQLSMSTNDNNKNDKNIIPYDIYSNGHNNIDLFDPYNKDEEEAEADSMLSNPDTFNDICWSLGISV